MAPLRRFAIFHVPHASMTIPPEIRKSFSLSDGEIETELIRMTDRFTEELFDCKHPLARMIVFPVSRLVVDPERFINDNDEPMSARGMGIVYTRTSDNQILRKNLIDEENIALVTKYYKPHQKKLASAVNNALMSYGRCLIIDCHSYPSTPLSGTVTYIV